MDEGGKKMINEIDFDMYCVLKWADIQKLPIEQRNKLVEIVDDIGIIRKKEGKPYRNRYLVLNSEDDIDRDELLSQLYHTRNGIKKEKVKDIACDIVNAILKAKEKPCQK